jgi:hypothetical protein
MAKGNLANRKCSKRRTFSVWQLMSDNYIGLCSVTDTFPCLSTKSMVPSGDRWSDWKYLKMSTFGKYSSLHQFSSAGWCPQIFAHREILSPRSIAFSHLLSFLSIGFNHHCFPHILA